MKKSIEELSLPSVEQLGEELNRLSSQKKYKSTLRSTVAVLLVVAAVAVLISTTFLPVLRIYGTSMNPALNNGDVVIALRSGSYQRGDVIAFYYNNKILVKRVIGLPGEIINVESDGTVTVDGEPLEEPYLTEKSLGECTIELPYEVPEGRYFVMGDNREVSSDSRSESIGCAAEEQIVGKLVFRVWPLGEFGLAG